MLTTDLNWLAVLVAAAANVAIGFLWYSPPAFGRRWMELIGRRQEDLAAAGPIYALTIVGALISSLVIATIVHGIGATTFATGFQVGFLGWLGFTFPATLADYLFAARSSRLWLINNSYTLIVFLVMGMILAGWR